MSFDNDTDLYTSHYCEENIYLLAKKKLESLPIDDSLEFFVVFISNPLKQIPLWHQKLQINQPVIWDYHDILLEKCVGKLSYIYDMDTKLSYPINAIDYCKYAVGHGIYQLNEAFIQLVIIYLYEIG